MTDENPDSNGQADQLNQLLVDFNEDIIEAIQIEDGENWEDGYIPGMDRIDGTHLTLNEAEMNRMSKREWSLYRAGIIEGLAKARDILQNRSDEHSEIEPPSNDLFKKS